MPLPLFVEFFTSDLKKETSANVYEKLLCTVGMIEEMLGTKCVYGFISDSCNVMKR